MKLVFNTALQQGARTDGTGLVLNGATSNYASTPDTSALDITGDIEIIFRAKIDATSTNRVIVDKRGSSTGGYGLYWNAFNGWTFEWHDSVTYRALTSAAYTPDNSVKWYRFTFDVDNGAGQRTLISYRANDSATVPTVWTTEATVNGAGTTSIGNSPSPLTVGANSSLALGTSPFEGTIYRAIIKDGIGGTTVFDANFAAQPANIYSFTESSSNAATVTINSTHNLVTLPLGGTVNVNIDWGDGTSDIRTVAGNFSHRYPTVGTYTTSIRGSMTAFSGLSVLGPKLVALQSFGARGLLALANISFLFSGTSSPTVVPAFLPITVNTLNSLCVTNGTFNTSLNSWDTTNVTDMTQCFDRATLFNQPLNNWNTANVTSMALMFRSSQFNQNISNWNTGKVTAMNSMFNGASSFNQPIGSWNTANVTNMSQMFYGCTAFNQDLSGWNTSKVTDMSGLFWDSISSKPALNVNSWDVRKVTSMFRIFQSGPLSVAVGGWRPSRCNSFDNFTLGTWSTASYDSLLTGWTDFTGTGWESGSITSVADAGGGQVTVTTSTAHGYPNGHVMRITGTSNYNGSYVISNVASTTFRITATFVSTQAGTWNATLQTGPILRMSGSKYSAGAAATARGVLTSSPYNWTIIDGGPA